MAENESDKSTNENSDAPGTAPGEQAKPRVQMLSASDVRLLEDQDTPTIWSYIIPHLVGWGVAILLLFAAISFSRPVWEPIMDFTLSLFNASSATSPSTSPSDSKN